MDDSRSSTVIQVLNPIPCTFQVGRGGARAQHSIISAVRHLFYTPVQFVHHAGVQGCTICYRGVKGCLENTAFCLQVNNAQTTLTFKAVFS